MATPGAKWFEDSVEKIAATTLHIHGSYDLLTTFSTAAALFA
jgi:hypothetical protein